MSTTLFMQAVPRVQPKVVPLAYELKRAISRRLWDNDGTPKGSKVRLDTASVPYLEGLVDGGVEGAEELLSAVIVHGAVNIWID